MPLVLAFDDIQPNQIKRNIGNQDGKGPDKPSSSVFMFCRAKKETPVAPSAGLVRYEKGTRSSAHFHWTDQFNIVVEGKGLFGRHELAPYHVHFSRAYTPYGPLLPDKDAGWAFLTLRTRYEAGSQRLPDAYAKLKQIPHRQPWQLTRKVEFPTVGVMQEIEGIRDERGLYAHAVTLAPGASIATPSAARGDGQYVVVLQGSLVHEGRQYRAMTVVFIKPTEECFTIVAGGDGLQGLVLNFPEVYETGSTGVGLPPPAYGARKWRCTGCGATYDEALGMPIERIPPGTRWDSVPADWACPACGAAKDAFEALAPAIA